MSDTSRQCFISRERIAERVLELGQQISQDYSQGSLTIIGILKGSFIFMADLVRAIDAPCEMAFMAVSSYEGTQSTGAVRFAYDLDVDITGKNVLLVEDIIDTGNTLVTLLQHLSQKQPRSLAVACLLSKPAAHQHPLSLNYVGFEISNEFVIGYGLDLDGRERNLPDLWQLKPR